jgi:hypothetical protein
MKTYHTREGLIGSIGFTKDDDDNIEVVKVNVASSGEGFVFKDSFDSDDVIYVSENSAIDFNAGRCSFEDASWTRDKLIEYVQEEVRWAAEGTAIWTDLTYIVRLARYIHESAEWEDLSTRLDEWINSNDIEEDYAQYKKL